MPNAVAYCMTRKESIYLSIPGVCQYPGLPAQTLSRLRDKVWAGRPGYEVNLEYASSPLLVVFMLFPQQLCLTVRGLEGGLALGCPGYKRRGEGVCETELRVLSKGSSGLVSPTLLEGKLSPL